MNQVALRQVHKSAGVVALLLTLIFCPTSALAEGPAAQQSRAQAIQAILDYGGFVKYDDAGQVRQINLVYDYDEWGNRLECPATSDDILAVLPNFPEMKDLLIHGAQATDSAMEHVGQLKNLNRLLMWDAQVSDAGTVHLAGLRQLTNIHISNSKIGDGTLKVLAGLDKLTGMSLQGNNFTDDGLRHLNHMTQLKSLWIGLSKRKITDAGVAHLAGLTNLTQLELQGSAVTDAGLQQLRNLKNLKQLFLGESKVTSAGVRALEQAVPGLHVDYRNR